MSESMIDQLEDSFNEERQRWAGIVTVSGLGDGVALEAGRNEAFDKLLVAQSKRDQIMRTETFYHPAVDFLQSAFVLDAIVQGTERHPQQVFGLMSRTVITALAKDYGIGVDNLQFQRARLCRYGELGIASLSESITGSKVNRIDNDVARTIFEDLLTSYHSNRLESVAA